MSTKIKSKVVRATLANKDVLDMFQGVLGTSGHSTSLPITYPKYLRIQGHVDRFIRLLAVFCGSTPLAYFPDAKEHLKGYIDALKKQFSSSFVAPDLTQWIGPANIELQTSENYAKVPPNVVSQFSEIFAAVKKCNVVNIVIVACKNLIAYKKSIEDQNALKDRFLVKGAGMSFAPLPDLPQVNFKQIYIDDRLTPSDKEFVLLVLHKVYTIGHDVYDAVSAPDVDVNEFVEVIMSSIGEVKKHIPRCDQAFDKIVESVDLLKGNFNGYYKDYTASGNPTIIMENFVLDVSKNTKSTPAVTAQFRRIITHYRKLASQQATNPKLQSLFAQVDANFQELERKSKDADDASSSDEEFDSESKAQPVAAAAASSKAARNRRKRVARAERERAAKALSDDAAAADDAADDAADAAADGAAADGAAADDAAADDAATDDAAADDAAAAAADDAADDADAANDIMSSVADMLSQSVIAVVDSAESERGGAACIGE